MLKLLKRVGLVLALAVPGATSAFAESHLYRLYVDGLACPFCAYGVEKQVGGLENVETVDILINEGIVAVTMASGKTLDEASARRAVSDAGFTLREFEPVKDQ
jgi:mercuric ion binding protein